MPLLLLSMLRGDRKKPFECREGFLHDSA